MCTEGAGVICPFSTNRDQSFSNSRWEKTLPQFISPEFLECIETVNLESFLHSIVQETLCSRIWEKNSLLASPFWLQNHSEKSVKTQLSKLDCVLLSLMRGIFWWWCDFLKPCPRKVMLFETGRNRLCVVVWNTFRLEWCREGENFSNDPREASRRWRHSSRFSPFECAYSQNHSYLSQYHSKTHRSKADNYLRNQSFCLVYIWYFFIKKWQI